MKSITVVLVTFYIVFAFWTARNAFPRILKSWTFSDSPKQTDVSMAIILSFVAGFLFPLYWTWKFIGFAFMDYAKKVSK